MQSGSPSRFPLLRRPSLRIHRLARRQTRATQLGGTPAHRTCRRAVATVVGCHCLKHGEPFNPRNTFVGIFIPEALAASMLISSTAKLAYGHLVRRAGGDGRCFPSANDVGRHTGVGERAAKRALKELQNGDPPLIRATFRADKFGRQTSNEYAFIWGPILEGVKNDTPVRNDTHHHVENDPHGGVKNDTRKVKERKVSEEKCQKEGSSSSDSQNSPAMEQKTESTTIIIPSNAKPENKTWTPTDIAGLKAGLALHRGQDTTPDVAITSRIIAHLPDPDDGRAWLGDLLTRFDGSKVKSWGFYEADVRTVWPGRRADATAELQRKQEQDRKANAKRERAVRDMERRRAIKRIAMEKNWKQVGSSFTDCVCVGYGRIETGDFCKCELGAEAANVVELERIKCRKCGNQGTVPDATDPTLIMWCDHPGCENAVRVKKEAPNLVDGANKLTLKMQSRGIFPQMPARSA